MMRASAAEQGWKGALRRRGGWLLLAALVVAVPRLLTAAPLGALDGLGLSGPTIDRTELSDQNFPGSAFFFAEGAFDPVPGAKVISNEHVLGLDDGPAAPALAFRGLTAVDGYRALHCLTSAIYYEAANEPDDGQRAVAQVVLNRVRHPAWPNSVCGVVYQGSERTDMKCQFTFSCDGAMARRPSAAAWNRARQVAIDALSGKSYAPVGLATHYHTLAVRPHWAPSLHPVAVVGAHIFYRWRGNAGLPPAFADRYTGRELVSGPSPRLVEAQAAAAQKAIPTVPLATPYNGGLPHAQPSTATPMDDGLPMSTIRPEYRNSGRPII